MDMDESLKQIIQSSTIEIIPGKFVYARVTEAPLIDNHFLVCKDQDEITVVTAEVNIQELEIIEKNKDYWALIALNVFNPFQSVGFLATASKVIADKGQNVLIVSTYSRDYILVQYEFLNDAKNALLSLGLKLKL